MKEKATHGELLAYSLISAMLWVISLCLFGWVGGWRLTLGATLLVFSINLSEWVREHR